VKGIRLRLNGRGSAKLRVIFNKMIYHIINRTTWQQAQAAGVYQPPSLASEGFIHFSKLEQVEATVARFYANERDLLLLEVAESKLTARLIYERATDVAELFPHLYGALNLEAVVRVFAFSAENKLPTQLRQQLSA
jgi:uncharacterized protein (DUF952 family)